MIKPTIIYQDDFLAVIDKPSGLVVNRSETAPVYTLQDFIDQNITLKVDSGFEEIADDYLGRSGLGHRIDKDTSGLLLVAKDTTTFLKLLAMFKKKTINKEYLVLVHGVIKEANFVINAPIGRNPVDRQKFGIVEGGRDSKTKFEKIKSLVIGEDEFTYLKAYPVTGRTHQIRVHLSALGHPVVGDVTYCSRKKLRATDKLFNRMMLHAHKISFIHPITQRAENFISPVPTEFLLEKYL